MKQNLMVGVYLRKSCSEPSWMESDGTVPGVESELTETERHLVMS